MSLHFPRRWLGHLFRPLEQKLLHALADHLSPEARSLLAKQVEQTNLVQRHAKDKEVNLYHMRRGKVSREGVPVFPLLVPEVKLARISFTCPDRERPLRANFWLVNGRLFSLDFDQSPRGIDADDIDIAEVELLADPMVSVEVELRRSREPDDLTGWLRDWSKKWRAAGLREPVPSPRREQIIQEIDAELPGDYLQVAEQTEGMQIDGCLILGLTAIRSLVFADANYYVLAEVAERGVLAVKAGALESAIYFLGYEEELEEMGASLRSAVERLLSRQ